MSVTSGTKDKYSELKPFERFEENCFSYWFPKIEKAGFLTPKTVFATVPKDIRIHAYDKDGSGKEFIQKWMKTEILPMAKEAGIPLEKLFIKNSTYSHKFDADNSCFCSQRDIAEHFYRIMQEDDMMDVGGNCEIVVRERIPFNSRQTPTIYNGLPLRPEFRVFYDFDDRNAIFCANYWDFDYVAPHIFNRTDKIVFEGMRKELQESFEAYSDIIMAMVEKKMATVEGLHGPWSVDFMLAEDYRGQKKLYLIDMAVAEQSAYWEFRPGVEQKAQKERKLYGRKCLPLRPIQTPEGGVVGQATILTIVEEGDDTVTVQTPKCRCCGVSVRISDVPLDALKLLD